MPRHRSLGTYPQTGAGRQLRVVFTPDNRATYAVVTATVTLDIAPAPLRIIADDVAIVPGSPLPQPAVATRGSWPVTPPLRLTPSPW